MKTSLQIVRFNAGELSPYMSGRSDTEAYGASCSVLENMIPSVQGPASRRGGTRFMAQVKYPAKQTRLFPFQFSGDYPYLLEFGDGYIRFFFHRRPIVDADGAPLEIQTPYASGDLAGLRTTQSGDVLFLVHPKHPIYKLIRHSNVSWSLESVEFVDGPYLPVNTSEISIKNSALTGTVTLTASAALFSAGDVGRHVRLRQSANPNVQWGAAKITAVTSPTQATAQVFEDFPFLNTNATKAWRLGAFCASAGYASCAEFFEQRLVLGKGNAVYGSCTGKYEIFSPSAADGTVSADMGYNCEISSQQINDVVWLSSGRALAIGTIGADFTMTTNEGTTSALPLNVQIVRHSTYGSERVTPVKISNTTLFVQRYGRKVRAFTYDSASDGYIARDVTILAEHVTKSGIVELALQQEPVPVVWCILKSGELAGMTFDAENNVQAWHRHPMTNGAVESLTTLPAENGSCDELYLIVRREINGEQKRYIEVMERGLEDGAVDAARAFYVDSGLSYEGDPVSAVGGLEHLEGQTVSVLANGAVQPDKTVVNGRISLDTPASVVHAGLPFTSVLTPSAFASGGAVNPAEALKKRVSGVIVRLYKSLGFEIGTKKNVEMQIFRTCAEKMNSAPALFTGDKKVAFSGAWGEDATVRIEQNQPLPLTVLAVYPVVCINNY